MNANKLNIKAKQFINNFSSYQIIHLMKNIKSIKIKKLIKYKI